MTTLLLFILAILRLPHLGFEAKTNTRVAWVILIVAVVLFVVWPNGLPLPNVRDG